MLVGGTSEHFILDSLKRELQPHWAISFWCVPFNNPKHVITLCPRIIEVDDMVHFRDWKEDKPGPRWLFLDFSMNCESPLPSFDSPNLDEINPMRTMGPVQPASSFDYDESQQQVVGKGKQPHFLTVIKLQKQTK